MVHGGTLGIVLISLAAVAVAAVIVILSRRNPVHADNVNDSPAVPARPAAPQAEAGV